MAYGADGGQELVHVERVELGLEELGTENVLVAERRCTDIVDGITAHVGKARLPPGDKSVEPLVLQTYLLHRDGVLGLAQFTLERELAVERLVDGERHGGYLVDEPAVHLVLVLLKPVVFAQIHPGGVAHARHALIVGRPPDVCRTATQRRKQARFEFLAAIVFHLLHEGMYGIAACHTLGLVGRHELQVRPVAEDNRVLGIGNGIARSAEVGGQFRLAHHIVDTVLQHCTLLAVHDDGA